MKRQGYFTHTQRTGSLPKTIRELPPIDRPRERLMTSGAGALSDTELLAVLLGSGVKGAGALALASRVLRHVAAPPARWTVECLLRVPGIGHAKACQIVAAFELARRHLLPGRATIQEAEDVVPYLQHIRDKRQEHFVCLSLSGANEVIESRVVTVGLLDSSQVHPREVFADPIGDRAAAVIVAHNHPSGTLEASPEDIALTQRLANAGRLLGIGLLDHLIVSKQGFLSLKQAGLMQL